MSTVELSTDIVASTAADLARRSHQWAVTLGELRRDLARLAVVQEPAAVVAIGALASASGSLLTVAQRLTGLSQAASNADRFMTCTGTSSPGGDPEETFTCAAKPGRQLAGGRDLMTTALSDTADEAVIGRDEFEIFRVAADRYVLVLAGVTDLGRPDPGYDEQSATVRDLDQGAVASAVGADLDRNEYARYVSDAVRAYIPEGSHIAIVGHSYGADTGLDLAADRDFNGERYVVTHVAAFGYHVDQHIGAVPERTDVIAINNSLDVVVTAEALADGPHLVSDGLLELRHDWSTGRLDRIAPSIIDLAHATREVGSSLKRSTTWAAATTIPLTHVDSDGNHHRVTFAGGVGLDAGHGQDRYIKFVRGTDLDVVTAFAASLEESGYAPTTPVGAIAVDVSRRP